MGDELTIKVIVLQLNTFTFVFMCSSCAQAML